MKRKYFFGFFLSLGLLLTLAGCKKTETYPSDKPIEYMPLFVGKYITYRLDSLVFLNFGTQDSIFSYLAKDVVEDSISDNTGRPSWMVVRYLNDTTGSLEWTPIETYMVTPTQTSIEVVENNLRFIKLVSPIINQYNWSGNAYIDTRSVFSEVPYMDGWTYYYDSVGMSYPVINAIIPNTIIVQQANDSSGSVADDIFSTRDFSQEVYGKGIGMIYKNFLHWEYQPPNANVPVGSTSGFGIKLTMVDHN